MVRGHSLFSKVPLVLFAYLYALPAFGQNGSFANVTVSNKLTTGPSNLLEPYIPGTESVSQSQSTSAKGQTAILGFVRSSDNPERQASGDSISISGIALNNATDYARTVYAGYFEARRFTGAGTTHGIEVDTLNTGSATYDIDPYSPTRSNASIGLHLSAGRPDQSSQNLFTTPVSVAINIINNGAAFRRGISCGINSLQDQDASAPFPNYDCLAMPDVYHVSWYAGAGNRNVTIGAPDGAFRVDGPGIDVPSYGSSAVSCPPAANVSRLFIDSADGKLKRKHLVNGTCQLDTIG